MKTIFSLIGCFIICVCFSGCKDEEKGITEISVTPGVVAALDLGATAQLTAVIAPADADEQEIFWVSYDPTTVEISGNGLQATVTALAPGTIAVFATNKSGVVVSNEVNVTVVPPDYAALIVGEYTGTAEVPLMGAILPDTKAYLERVGDEKGIVKFMINAAMPGFGMLTAVAETVSLRETSPNQFSLQGAATIDAGVAILELTLTGTANASDHTLEVSLVAVEGSVMPITINYTAGLTTRLK
ncbi:MAG: Ig-like domain-containing protein [Tannerellaceae bacterium]|jgi:hypothetical protein|nr:Ig-like domain-containing protein [Tannerellaceae bacterium]